MNARRQQPPQAEAFAGITGNPSLEALLAETAALFHRLRTEAQEMHGEGEASAGKRAVLLSLGRRGPQSVPTLARSRPVSRQYMQTLVNALLEAGLVKQQDNPAHRRSPLIAITDAGEARIEDFLEREREAFSNVQLAVRSEDLEKAAQTLREVRRIFESDEWRRARRQSAKEERA